MSSQQSKGSPSRPPPQPPAPNDASDSTGSVSVNKNDSNINISNDSNKSMSQQTDTINKNDKSTENAQNNGTSSTRGFADIIDTPSKKDTRELHIDFADIKHEFQNMKAIPITESSGNTMQYLKPNNDLSTQSHSSSPTSSPGSVSCIKYGASNRSVSPSGGGKNGLDSVISLTLSSMPPPNSTTITTTESGPNKPQMFNLSARPILGKMGTGSPSPLQYPHISPFVAHNQSIHRPEEPPGNNDAFSSNKGFTDANDNHPITKQSAKSDHDTKSDEQKQSPPDSSRINTPSTITESFIGNPGINHASLVLSHQSNTADVPLASPGLISNNSSYLQQQTPTGSSPRPITSAGSQGSFHISIYPDNSPNSEHHVGTEERRIRAAFEPRASVYSRVMSVLSSSIKSKPKNSLLTSSAITLAPNTINAAKLESSNNSNNSASKDATKFDKENTSPPSNDGSLHVINVQDAANDESTANNSNIKESNQLSNNSPTASNKTDNEQNTTKYLDNAPPYSKSLKPGECEHGYPRDKCIYSDKCVSSGSSDLTSNCSASGKVKLPLAYRLFPFLPMKMEINKKLAIIFALQAFIFVGAVTLVGWLISYHYLYNLIVNECELLVEMKAAELGSVINSYINSTSAISAQSGVQSVFSSYNSGLPVPPADTTTAELQLSTIISGNPIFYLIDYYALDGTMILSSNSSAEPSFSDLEEAACGAITLNGNNQPVLSPDSICVTQPENEIFTAPITVDGAWQLRTDVVNSTQNLIGTTRLVLDPTPLYNILWDVGYIEPSGEWLLIEKINSTSWAFAFPPYYESELYGVIYPVNLLPITEWALNADTSDGPVINTVESFFGATVLAAVAIVPGTPWYMIYQVSNHAVTEPVRRLRTALICTWVATLVGAVVMSIPAAKMLVVDIVRMTKASSNISSGDLSARVPYRHSWFPDEITQLAISFNDMADRLSNYYGVLEQKVRERTIELEDAKIRADAASATKSAFLATITHELRTPLNGIIGLSAILAESELNADQRDLLGSVRECSDNLLTIINDVLDFSKIEAGKLTLDVEPFSLRKCMETVSHLLLIKASQKDIQCSISIADNVPQVIYGDVNRIKQILINLVGNAAKFTHKGEIKVIVTGEKIERKTDDDVKVIGDSSGNDTVAEGDTNNVTAQEQLRAQNKLVDAQQNEWLITFKVRDTGIGIHADSLQHLFKSFSQVDSTTTRQYGGTGLGLAICRQLTEMMNGEIGVESVIGEGSLFWFTIPTRQGIIHEVEKTNSHQRLAETYPMKILIAEDNLVNQKLIIRMLQRYGYEPQVVNNGKEAVEYNAAYSPDLIFMDIQMPVLSGLQATQQIRNLPGKQPVIVALTANVLDGDREKCKEVGMNAHVWKPVSRVALEQILITWGSVIVAQRERVSCGTDFLSRASNISKITPAKVPEPIVEPKVANNLMPYTSVNPSPPTTRTKTIEITTFAAGDEESEIGPMSGNKGFCVSTNQLRGKKSANSPTFTHQDLKIPRVVFNEGVQDSKNGFETSQMDDYIPPPISNVSMPMPVPSLSSENSRQLTETTTSREQMDLSNSKPKGWTNMNILATLKNTFTKSTNHELAASEDKDSEILQTLKVDTENKSNLLFGDIDLSQDVELSFVSDLQTYHKRAPKRVNDGSYEPNFVQLVNKSSNSPSAESSQIRHMTSVGPTYNIQPEDPSKNRHVIQSRLSLAQQKVVKSPGAEASSWKDIISGHKNKLHGVVSSSSSSFTSLKKGSIQKKDQVKGKINALPVMAVVEDQSEDLKSSIEIENNISIEQPCSEKLEDPDSFNQTDAFQDLPHWFQKQQKERYGECKICSKPLNGSCNCNSNNLISEHGSSTTHNIPWSSRVANVFKLAKGTSTEPKDLDSRNSIDRNQEEK